MSETQSETQKITIEIGEGYIEFLQDLADRRSRAKDPGFFESQLEFPNWEDDPKDLTFMLIDAGLEQGVLEPYIPNTVELLWDNLDKLRCFSIKRDRKITEFFKKEYIEGNRNEKQLKAFTKQHPCPLQMLSEKLQNNHNFNLKIESADGYPGIKFILNDADSYMAAIPEDKRKLMLEISANILKEMEK